ncbi:hypothetical protein Ciccas_011090 [Cichlidogyrus casuarinus]|uniref:Uncharacterized protein n=1 Tax=Cichlidogyrus casuarinus TaxID=1844966 RepID=A0ABD2PV55_9PLAT
MHNDPTQLYQIPPANYTSQPDMLVNASQGVPVPPYPDIGINELPPDYTAASQPSNNIVKL